jgi:hypothetical protein
MTVPHSRLTASNEQCSDLGDTCFLGHLLSEIMQAIELNTEGG